MSYESTMEYLTKVHHIYEDWIEAVREDGEEVEVTVDFLPF
jgi:hypothetical protein